jgi:CheY-like chemotaxis protein
VAANGTEAIDLYRQHHQTLSLVLLDVRLPDMDGPATLAALQQIKPQVRCCFMSGHTGTHTPDQLLALGAVAFFPKPFGDLRAFAQAVWALATGGP